MGETIVTIDDITCRYLTGRSSSWGGMKPPSGIFAAGGCFARWDDIDDLASVLALTFLDGNLLARIVFAFTHRPEQPGKLPCIIAIKVVVFINTLSINDRLGDGEAFICFKGDN